MDIELINLLENVGLARAEAVVYVELLTNPDSNGSQIAKKINLPKPSIYLALDKLYQRGLINLIPGKSKQYRAQDPVIAFKQLKQQFNQTISHTLDKLEQIKPQVMQNEFLHIKGFSNFIAQLNSMFSNATQEIYLQTNVDLNLFAVQIEDVLAKGVRIITTSFGNQYHYPFKIEEYHDQHKTAGDSFRMIVVVDCKECIMSCGIPDENYLAIYTRQQLQVNILAENIHNDIYWHKLFKQKSNLSFDCKINTIMENMIQESGYKL